jgi:excisionase family DNA binding protein
MEKCYRAEDIGRILQVSKPTVYKLIGQPDFPKILVGRTIRIPVTAFERWLDEKSREGDIV